MLKFFFHHHSPTLHVVEALGVLALIAAALRIAYAGNSWIAWTALSLIALQYLFIRYCASRRWYKNARRFEGIELQFKKGMVPTVYLILIGCALFQIIPYSIMLIAAAMMLAIVAHVNVILLYLKHKDQDEMPVNYFSHNKLDARC